MQAKSTKPDLNTCFLCSVPSAPDSQSAHLALVRLPLRWRLVYLAFDMCVTECKFASEARPYTQPIAAWHTSVIS